MMFLDKVDVERKLKLLRQEILERSISEDLRGWNYDKPPIQPLFKHVKFGVSELAGRYCEKLRDIYLKRVLNIKFSPNLKIVKGIALHKIIKETIYEAKKFIYDNQKAVGIDLINALLKRSLEAAQDAVVDAEFTLSSSLQKHEKESLIEECLNTRNFLLIQAAAKLDYALSKYPHADSDSIVNIAIPPVVERKVDGSLVGLSNELSVDIYMPYNAIVDVKTGDIRDFHPLTAAGYALAIESEENIPIDFGFILYLKFERKTTPSFKLKHFIVGDELRREFIEIRDEAFEIVNSGRDPGMPNKCPDFCPYYSICK